MSDDQLPLDEKIMRVQAAVAAHRKQHQARPSPRRRAKPEQLVLDPSEQERKDRIRRCRAAYNERRKVCPDGRQVPDGMTWCGRCGEIIWAYSLVINHDLGYMGCPAEFDPAYRHGPEQPKPGCSRYSMRWQLSHDELNDRWDRQYFPDCECGCSCGIHDPSGLCVSCYRCDEYRPKGEPDATS